ncbi:hypothetical protein EC9_21050 [Rosistilla ulvae]|uniref:Uncharacterized protein n=1 Tax=Rosistilla ulvae TaxID=1930277 RepID=A0A517LZ75_9BACT|nr:hypothetical protein EC9_21050 [Rosistilla ulvae]
MTLSGKPLEIMLEGDEHPKDWRWTVALLWSSNGAGQNTDQLADDALVGTNRST